MNLPSATPVRSLPAADAQLSRGARNALRPSQDRAAERRLTAERQLAAQRWLRALAKR
jgi:hypothetical protein